MISVTPILVLASGFHQNIHLAAGQPWKLVAGIDTR